MINTKAYYFVSEFTSEINIPIIFSNLLILKGNFPT